MLALKRYIYTSFFRMYEVFPLEPNIERCYSLYPWGFPVSTFLPNFVTIGAVVSEKRMCDKLTGSTSILIRFCSIFKLKKKNILHYLAFIRYRHLSGTFWSDKSHMVYMTRFHIHNVVWVSTVCGWLKIIIESTHTGVSELLIRTFCDRTYGCSFMVYLCAYCM